MQQTKRRVAWLFGLACASQGRVHDAHAALSELVSQAADGGVELGPRMWTWGTRRTPMSLPSPSDALQVSRTLARLLVQHSKYALVLPVCDRVLSHCPDDVPLLVHKVRLVKPAAPVCIGCHAGDPGGDMHVQAEALVGTGKAEEALAVLTVALAAASKDAQQAQLEPSRKRQRTASGSGSGSAQRVLRIQVGCVQLLLWRSSLNLLRLPQIRNNIAAVQTRMGKLTDAAQTLRAVLDSMIRRPLGGGHKSMRHVVAFNLCLLQWRLKDRYRRPHNPFRKASQRLPFHAPPGTMPVRCGSQHASGS